MSPFRGWRIAGQPQFLNGLDEQERSRRAEIVKRRLGSQNEQTR